ncbi:MAG: hypothetical protein ACREOY_14660, partial [Candidatus Dormibacteraceae bacterium]
MNRARRALLSLPLTGALLVLGPFAGLTASAAAIGCTTPELVAAIAAANVQVGGGTVMLPSGCVYTLTVVNNTTDGGVALPVITGNVTIAGSGSTITRSTASGTPPFRFLDVSSTGKLNIDSLTLSNGLVNDGKNGGGAIDSHGTLVVTRSMFSGNNAPATSGTSGGAINNSGQLTVKTSLFVGNVAMEGGG